MSWQVTVSGVVDVLGREEVVWFVEFIELMVSKMFVIFNTITILVIDFLTVGVEGFFVLHTVKVLKLQSDVEEVLWATDITSVLGKFLLVAHLNSLEEHQLFFVMLSASQTNKGANCEFHFIFSN